MFPKSDTDPDCNSNRHDCKQLRRPDSLSSKAETLEKCWVKNIFCESVDKTLCLAAKHEKKWIRDSTTKARDIVLSLALIRSPDADTKRHNFGRASAQSGPAWGQPWLSLCAGMGHPWTSPGSGPLSIQILTVPCVNLRSIPGLDTNRKYLLGWLAG